MAESGHTPDSNKALVQASFDRWRSGTGSPFELLVPDAAWTIEGSSPLSKTYPRRQAFLDEVIGPFNARMATPLVPTVRGIYADGDMVIILFDATATTKDGRLYRNTYTWYFQMADGKVVNVIASLTHGTSTSSGRAYLRHRDASMLETPPRSGQSAATTLPL
jgi:uncharacterized protein